MMATKETKKAAVKKVKKEQVNTKPAKGIPHPVDPEAKSVKTEAEK